MVLAALTVLFIISRTLRSVQNSNATWMNFKAIWASPCISDMEPQPLLIQSHLGSYAITTVGKIANQEDLIREAYEKGHIHFLEMSGGKINATELVAAIINQAESIVDGLCWPRRKS